MASTSSLGAQSTTSTQEAQQFYDSFNKRLREVKEKIQEATGVGNLHSIFEDISKARTSLTEKTEQLPSYDRQAHEQHLKEVNQLLAEKRALLAPKPKFAFKRKPLKATTASPVSLPVVTNNDDVIQTTSISSTPSAPLSIRDKTGKVLDVSSLPESNQATDLHILNLQDCIVDLRELSKRPKFLALQLRNLHHCVILCGIIDGSTMIHDCSETLITLQCRQFRMHSSHSVAVLLSTSSVATIENCQTVAFAKLSSPQALPDVQDFDHISTLEPSPNWSVMGTAAFKAVESLIILPLPDVETLLHSAGLSNK